MENTIKKHPGIAAVLSFVFSGLGQLYNGQIAKGLWIVFLSALLMLAFMLSSVAIGLQLVNRALSPGQVLLSLAVFCSSLMGICLLGIYSIFDAYKQSPKQ